MGKEDALSWVAMDPQLSTAQSAPVTHIRREHKKSRNGCLNCRQRRIKCDELRHGCGQCHHRRIECQYQAGLREQLNPLPPDVHRVDDVFSSLPNEVPLHVEDSTTLDSSSFGNQEDIRNLLDHFIQTTIPWLGSPAYQEIIQTQLLVALEIPYLLHTILATSAIHINSFDPTEKHNLTAALYYQRALKDYIMQLGASIRTQNIDAIIGCAFLHTMLAFAGVSKRPADGLGPATWLRAMQGMTTLQRTEDFRPHFKNSIWLPVFSESGGCDLDVDCQHTSETGHDTWASSTSEMLHMLCEVPDEFHSSLGNPYSQSLKLLCRRMRLDPSHYMVDQFVSFIGWLPAAFVQLFEQNDTRAMLIMAYWCAMISGIDQWWIVDSAIAECRRLCAVLDSVSSREVRELLQFPARKCGYAIVRLQQYPGVTV